MFFKQRLLFSILLISTVLFSGCMDDFVRKEEFEVLGSSVSRRMNKLNYDINVTKGAANENRAAVETLQEQLEEVSNRLGMMNNNIKGVGQIESKFNSKIKGMMAEVVKENKRLIKEINKTRKMTTTETSSSGSNVNIYNKTSENKELNTGYYHTVETGESLSLIAKRFQVPIHDIVKANDLTNPDNLIKGQKLFIPDPNE